MTKLLLVSFMPSPASLSRLTIRTLSSADVLPAANLLQRSFAPPEGHNPIRRSLIVAEHVLSLRERASETGRNILLVGCDQEAVIGFVEIFCPDGPGSSTLPERLRKDSNLGPYVASLAVDTAHRRQGVGAALMRECEARLLSLPLPLPPAPGDSVNASRTKTSRCVITLEVEEENTAALALYRSLGYDVVARDPNARTLKGDIFFGTSEVVTKLRLEKALRVLTEA